MPGICITASQNVLTLREHGWVRSLTWVCRIFFNCPDITQAIGSHFECSSQGAIGANSFAQSISFHLSSVLSPSLLGKVLNSLSLLRLLTLSCMLSASWKCLKRMNEWKDVREERERNIQLHLLVCQTCLATIYGISGRGSLSFHQDVQRWVFKIQQSHDAEHILNIENIIDLFSF